MALEPGLYDVVVIWSVCGRGICADIGEQIALVRGEKLKVESSEF